MLIHTFNVYQLFKLHIYYAEMIVFHFEQEETIPIKDLRGIQITLRP